MGVVLVIDDEPGIREMLSVVLRRAGHTVHVAGDAESGLAIAQREPVEVVLLDLRMAPSDGLSCLPRLRAVAPDAFVIVMTAYAEWDTAVRAMRGGAFSFIHKPFDNQVLKATVARALAARDRALAARGSGEKDHAIHLIGTSPAILAVQQLIEQVAPTDATVLITGESGTGKELVARALHYASLRADRPMVRVNSGALTPTLLEAELFGHVKGAFTGAIDDRPGLFAFADGGTLFLDEVGDLAPETQVKLLRVLENGEYLPVGGREMRTCDVRIIAATNRDLPAMIAAGTFREDLYYRLAVITVHLPPLRERREDIPLLAGHLLARHAVKLRRGITGFTAAALEALTRYDWPGNVRELDNRIQRGVALTASGDIDAAALFDDQASGRRPAQKGAGDPLQALRSGQAIDFERAVADYERALLGAALAHSGDNLTQAAKLLNLSFRQIRYKVHQHGLR
ncbi:MAG: sigma-54 dependent transcriptional regulator [Planctomycetota bacterium]|nr:sigma-54 dependent transcriptional regulator [Planctomycetota bacterium]MCX8039970.1 sigma-54 dependent transcriptional regulator [Planctomycetota bacterium]MDW8372962.1 sigma-54 dependent transcriptional regulator [Planctomycetota bacterium]